VVNGSFGERGQHETEKMVIDWSSARRITGALLDGKRKHLLRYQGPEQRSQEVPPAGGTIQHGMGNCRVFFTVTRPDVERPLASWQFLEITGGPRMGRRRGAMSDRFGSI
jgi:hypothetical protein